jgi:hypothetical protein
MTRAVSFEIVDRPALLRLQADPRTVRPTTHIGIAVGRGGGPGRADQLGNRELRRKDALLELGDVAVIDHLVVRLRHRILPHEDFVGDIAAGVAGASDPCRGASA